LVLGGGLFAALLWNTDATELAGHLSAVGWLGLAGVVVLYAAAFYVDSASWLLTLTSPAINFTWSFRLFWVRLAGEAYNTLLPAAGFCGEPLKVVLLPNRYGINPHEATASPVVARTVNLIGLVMFLLVGFSFMLASEQLPAKLNWVATALIHIKEIETHFTHFYRARGAQLPMAIGAQEGVFVMLALSMTGQPAIGAAMALTRRAREVLWVGLGLAVSTTLALRDPRKNNS
jgi:hypothetical protein